MELFLGVKIKEEKQQYYSEYNDAVYEAERAILFAYDIKYLLIKDSWIMKIIDTIRILYLKNNCKYFKIKNIADELENNFTDDYLKHMKNINKDWKNTLNSYFTKWKCKLFYQVKLESGKRGYWTLYNWYSQD